MAAPKNISQTDVDEMVRLYNNNVKQREIAKIFNIDESCIGYHLKRRGVLVKNKNYFTKEEISLIIKFYLSGMNTNDLAKQFDTKVRSIVHLLHRQNIPVKRHKPTSSFAKLNIPDSEVLQKYEELQNSRAVAEFYGTNYAVINKILSRNNVDSFRVNLRNFLLEHKEYIIDRYTNGDGIGINTIAAELEIDRDTLYKTLKRWGIVMDERSRNRKIIEKNKEQIYSLYYNDFLSIREISDIYNIGECVINGVFTKYGWQKRQNFCNTSIERKTKAMLENLKIDFVLQFPIERMKFDFYLPKHNLLIETHGDYWHGNPREYKVEELDDIQKKNVKRDVAKKNLADKYNHKLVIFWEWDINNRLDAVKEIISNEVNFKQQYD